MEKLDSFAQEEAEMVAVATYVLKEVKENIDGVGLNSSVWLLRKDGTNELFEQDDLNDLEVLMERFNEVINVAFDAAFDLGGSRPTPTGLPSPAYPAGDFTASALWERRSSSSWRIRENLRSLICLPTKKRVLSSWRMSPSTILQRPTTCCCRGRGHEQTICG